MRERQEQLRERRAELALWARGLLDEGGLAVVWVTVHEAPLTASGRRRPPLAARVHVVDEDGQRLADVLVRLAGPRTTGVPAGTVPAAEGAEALSAAFSGRRRLQWTRGALQPVTERLEGLGHRLEAGQQVPAPDVWDRQSHVFSGQMRDVLAQWHSELHPTTGELLPAWKPGTADRLHLALARIADGTPTTAAAGKGRQR